MTVSPSQPQYYMYTFPKDVDTVLLRVTSNDPLCAVISVQPIKVCNGYVKRHRIL